MEKKYIPGGGNSDCKLMVIGDSPTYTDTQEGKLFSGQAGRELFSLMKDAGINPNDCWFTAVSKYEVPENVGAKKQPFHIRARNVGIDIEKEISDLQREVNAIKPNCILALGSSALWALSGKDRIANYRGSILHGMGRKFIATYRPSDLLFNARKPEFRGYWNRFVILFDFKRARYQSTFPEYIVPQRYLEICESSAQLQAFRDRYRGKIRLSTDVEAGGHCIPICIGFSFSRKHGITVPLWNRDGISSIPDGDLAQIWLIVAEMLLEHDIVGQNFNYDRDKLRRLGFIIRRLASDTMYKSFAINPELPKRLAFNQSIYTEEPFYKDEGMYEGSLRDLFLGCARDACVTLEIDEEMDSDLDELQLRPFYENFLMKLPDLYLEIENTGFKVDYARRDELLKKYVEWDERLRYELFKLVGTEINVYSSKQVYTLLFDNLKLPRRSGTGEEELTSLLNLQSFTNKEHRRIVELVLEDRRVRKSISTYLMALPDFDGRMKTTCFPCLETGRSNTSQQDPPIRPTIDIVGKGNKKDMKVLGIAFQTMTKHGDIGADIRSQYVADDEHVFIQADSSQAEARVVFKLANDEQALKDIDEHDYHALTASWFFGGTEDDYSKKKLGYESPIRFAGKTLRHSGHLGAGKRRAAISVNTDARKYKIPSLSGRTGEYLQITEQIAEKALIIFHQRQPKIQRIFHAGIIEALKHKRRLYAAIPYGVDSPVGPCRIFYERWGDELFRQAFSYIPQRTVTDNTKAAGLRIKARFPECKIVMESHDALLFLVRQEYTKDFAPIVKQEFERPINFTVCSLPRTRLVIPCEIESAENYYELKKFKDFVPFDVKPKGEIIARPKTFVEEFLAEPVLPADSQLDSLIYEKKYGKYRY